MQVGFTPPPTALPFLCALLPHRPAPYRFLVLCCRSLTVRPTVATADACPLKYKRFYPVCFTTEEDSLDFGPLYDPAAETTFDVDTALLVNAGVAAGADICLTYDTPFLKESLCAETCVRENPGTSSTDAPLGLGSYKLPTTSAPPARKCVSRTCPIISVTTKARFSQSGWSYSAVLVESRGKLTRSAAPAMPGFD